MQYFCAGILFFTLLIGCNPPMTELDEPSETYFFPAGDYITSDYKEARQLSSLNKVVRINETTDSILISDTFDVKELQMLTDIDINNPKWADKYTGDTIYGLYGDAESLKYQAQDPKLPVQRLEVFMQSGNVVTIKALTQRMSLINKHKKSLIYYPGRGYELTSVQESWTGDTIRLEVNAYFVK